MKKNVLSLVTAAAMVAVTFAGCTSDKPTAPAEQASTAAVEATTQAADNASTEATENVMAAAPGEEAGFEETPIFENYELDFIDVSAVFFQPVPMAPGQEDIEGYDLHLECDVSALENDLGYELGSWIPYLTVDYKIVDHETKEPVKDASGSFMAMAASDGPHYGANIKLPEAGVYDITFTFHSPAENGYLIHSDAETGPGGLLEDHFKDGNLEYTYEGWEYTPQEWN